MKISKKMILKIIKNMPISEDEKKNVIKDLDNLLPQMKGKSIEELEELKRKYMNADNTPNII